MQVVGESDPDVLLQIYIAPSSSRRCDADEEVKARRKLMEDKFKSSTL